MKPIVLLGCGLLSLVGLSCGNSADHPSTNTDTARVATTSSAPVASDAQDNWVVLFDGRSLAGWHGFNRKGGAVTNWDVEDSALVCLGAAKDAHGGDIVSDASFDNFELTWDWKSDPGSNSGVMYHVVENLKYKAPYETGPEYQLIDDVGFPEKLQEWQKTGADYAMTPAGNNKKLKPVGQWNSSRILFNNGHVEHWLNGSKIVEFQAWTDDWNRKRTTGKWKDYPDYGKAKTGGIALQDHGNKMFFRNIKIRRL